MELKQEGFKNQIEHNNEQTQRKRIGFIQSLPQCVKHETNSPKNVTYSFLLISP